MLAESDCLRCGVMRFVRVLLCTMVTLARRGKLTALKHDHCFDDVFSTSLHSGRPPLGEHFTSDGERRSPPPSCQAPARSVLANAGWQGDSALPPRSADAAVADNSISRDSDACGAIVTNASINCG